MAAVMRCSLRLPQLNRAGRGHSTRRSPSRRGMDRRGVRLGRHRGAALAVLRQFRM